LCGWGAAKEIKERLLYFIANKPKVMLTYCERSANDGPTGDGVDEELSRARYMPVGRLSYASDGIAVDDE